MLRSSIVTKTLLTTLFVFGLSCVPVSTVDKDGHDAAEHDLGELAPDLGPDEARDDDEWESEVPPQDLDGTDEDLADQDVPDDGIVPIDLTEQVDADVPEDEEPDYDVETIDTIDLDPVAAVCARWRDDRAQRSEGAWSGSVQSCEPGAVSAEGVANVLRQINLYRWLVALPPVWAEPGLMGDAQACALMMTANGQLSHSPPSSWSCYSEAGASGAGRSNIAGAPGVQAVDMYVSDWGNESTYGHRRWLLSNSLGPVGPGSTDRYSCLTVTSGGGSASAPWLAFPSGITPIELLDIGYGAFNWTVQSDAYNVNNATVTVSMDGAELPVVVNNLVPGYGSSSAISIAPQNWTPVPDSRYRVVLGLESMAMPLEYEIHFVSCAN